MDIGTISLVLVLGLVFLLAIGMPLGLASAVLAVVVLVLKFEPTLITAPWCYLPGVECEGIRTTITARPGTGLLYLPTQKMFDLMTDYVLISVPLFIFMAALLERSGIAKTMYDSLNFWLSQTRGGIAIVTSLMAVLMAAMSGIIGGEVVMLGLIALPQMLRLGYNQNLAIGTICASGSLGTMIPPSIVLIMFGLITETSIKKLFSAAFVPGFMLASFIIIYIIIRTQLRAQDAPKPDLLPGEPSSGEKAKMFASFMATLTVGLSTILSIRVLFLWALGRSTSLEEGVEPFTLGMPHHLIYFCVSILICLVLIYSVFGRERTARGWAHGKGLVPPMTIIGVVLGSIYGGISGITESAGMGALAVFLFAIYPKTSMPTGSWSDISGVKRIAAVPMAVIWVVRNIDYADMADLIWYSVMRTLRSTGTIIWVTIGAAALAGAYTVAGGPNYIANLIVGSEMSTMFILLTMMLILLFMGAFMDWVGIVLLIIPVFLPIVRQLPLEEIGYFGQLQANEVAIWFGVLFCMNMQVSFLSPPFGPAAFYLKSVAPPHISLVDIFKGFLPFIGIQLLALAVLLVWPSIVTILL